MADIGSTAPDGVSWLELGPPPTPTTEVQAVLDRTRDRLGYVRNGQVALLHRPEVILAQDALSRAATTGEHLRLPRREREIIALVVSAENRCEPCLAGHAATLREITGDPVLVDRITVNHRHAGLSARERALADYALKLTRDPAAMEAGDLGPLRAAGLAEVEIMEAAAIAAYFNFSNRLNSGLGVPANREAFLAHR